MRCSYAKSLLRNLGPVKRDELDDTRTMIRNSLHSGSARLGSVQFGPTQVVVYLNFNA